MRIRGIPHVSPSFVLLNVLFLLISLLGAGKAMIYMGPWISETDPLCPKNRPLETKHFHVMSQPIDSRSVARSDSLTP
jgi:hypothetical protein